MIERLLTESSDCIRINKICPHLGLRHYDPLKTRSGFLLSVQGAHDLYEVALLDAHGLVNPLPIFKHFPEIMEHYSEPVFINVPIDIADRIYNVLQAIPNITESSNRKRRLKQIEKAINRHYITTGGY